MSNPTSFDPVTRRTVSAEIRQRLADPKSDLFVDDEATRAEVEPTFTADKTFYDQDNVFWVPPTAHFTTLLKQAADVELPQKLDAAMGEIEAENASLKGVLYREFSRLALAEALYGGEQNMTVINMSEFKLYPCSFGFAGQMLQSNIGIIPNFRRKRIIILSCLLSQVKDIPSFSFSNCQCFTFYQDFPRNLLNKQVCCCAV